MKFIVGVAAVLAALILSGSAIVLARHYVGLASHPTATAVACKQRGEAHQAVIHDSKLSVTEIDGKLCDTLTITNEDARIRLLAFGQHDHHQAYDGVLEKALAQNQSLTIVFDQVGSFTFHDHLEDEVIGHFTVIQ